MTSHVHIAIGVAASLAAASFIPALTPESEDALLLETALAATGTVLPDIDLNGKSNVKKWALTAVLAVAAVSAFIYRAGQLETIKSLFGVRLVAGILLFTVCTAIGLISNHRSFTHSLLGLFLFSTAVFLLLGPVPALWFAAAMLSHDLADTLNMTKVRWLYPAKKGVALGLCKSSGLIAELIGLIFTVLAVLLFRNLWYAIYR